MADNIQVTQGSGTTMATDDVSGIQYPRVKVSVGADGSATDVSSSNPMPVADSAVGTSLASIDGKLPSLSGGRVPVDVGGATVNITGPVTVSNEVEIKNDVGNPIPISDPDDSYVVATASSTTPLAGGATYTSAAFEVTKYSAINVNVFSNVASATDGLRVEFSTDGTNWDHSHRTTYPGTTGIGYIFNVEYRYARVVFVNGATAQAAFRLQTILKRQFTDASLFTLDQTVSGTMFSKLVKSALTAKNPSGSYISIDATNGGNLKVSLEEIETGVVIPVTDNGGSLTVDGSVSVSNFPATQAVTGPLTDSQLRASAVPVSVSGVATAANQTTQTTELQAIKTAVELIDNAIAGSEMQVDVITSALPTGAATSALQTTGNNSLSSIDSKLPALFSGRVPVDVTGSVTVSNEIEIKNDAGNPVPVSGTVTANTGLSQPLTDAQLRATAVPVSAASLPLPTGAATETTLASLDGKFGSLGQKTMANSAPVVIASDQSAIPITGSITATNPSVGSTGAAVPASATYVAAVDTSGNLTGLKVDATGALITAGGGGGGGSNASVGTVNTTAPSSATLIGGEDSTGKLQDATISTGQASGSDRALNVKSVPAFNWHADTSKVIAASGIDTTFWDVIYASAGQAYSQSIGRLQMNTTGNAFLETVIRSKQSFKGNIMAKALIQSLARYSGAGGMFELVDVIGNDLVCTVNSSTDATITIPNNPFTSENIGQSFYLGGYSGTGVLRPGRYAISAVSGNDVTLTISSGTAGSGTVCAWGYNYAGYLFTSNSATSNAIRVHRNGWPSTTNQSTITTSSTNSTAEFHINLEENMVSFFDQTAADVTNIDTSNLSMRIRALNHVPDPSKEYYLQLRVYTDSTTTSTAWYFFHPNVAVYNNQPVTLINNKPQGANSTTPVRVSGGTLGTVSTVSTVSTVNTVTTVASVTSVAQSRPSTPAITSDNLGTITSTTTSSTYSPTWGSNYVFTVAVTAASGTDPTLDVAVQATDDVGTNWYTIYEFPRITGLGRWASPPIRNNGLNHRFVSTVGGTSPSFGRTIRRSALAVDRNTARSIIDRTIDLNTLNSVSRTMVADYVSKFNFILNCTAQTTAATVTIQFSDDEVFWVDHPTTLTSLNGTALLEVSDRFYRYVRAKVTAAGSGITLDQLVMKGFEQ